MNNKALVIQDNQSQLFNCNDFMRRQEFDLRILQLWIKCIIGFPNKTVQMCAGID